ncbi:MAG: FitA-like ribbon-helix-helix domain-containing protein [Candidatus Rokuibacteriota bacterium]
MNVKKVPDALYRKLQAHAKRQRRSVAQEVVHLLSQALDEPEPRSILELRGLGKARWRRVDASRHVARERHSWA